MAALRHHTTWIAWWWWRARWRNRCARWPPRWMWSIVPRSSAGRCRTCPNWCATSPGWTFPSMPRASARRGCRSVASTATGSAWRSMACRSPMRSRSGSSPRRGATCSRSMPCSASRSCAGRHPPCMAAMRWPAWWCSAPAIRRTCWIAWTRAVMSADGLAGAAWTTVAWPRWRSPAGRACRACCKSRGARATRPATCRPACPPIPPLTGATASWRRWCWTRPRRPAGRRPSTMRAGRFGPTCAPCASDPGASTPPRPCWAMTASAATGSACTAIGVPAGGWTPRNCCSTRSATTSARTPRRSASPIAPRASLPCASAVSN